MRNTTGVPTLTDTDLNDHIDDLQSQLSQLQISLQLAKEERDRRAQNNLVEKDLQISRTSPKPKLESSDTSPSTFRIRSTVRIKNKYRGNRGKVGKIIQLSTKTATVFIPNEGNYIKLLHNLEVLST